MHFDPFQTHSALFDETSESVGACSAAAWSHPVVHRLPGAFTLFLKLWISIIVLAHLVILLSLVIIFPQQVLLTEGVIAQLVTFLILTITMDMSTLNIFKGAKLQIP